ncbi:MAG: hypothetical protein JO119_10295 [Acidobacteria bacterium]|nr:hypothetical protein [Acidobacteriota bacterium]
MIRIRSTGTRLWLPFMAAFALSCSAPKPSEPTKVFAHSVDPDGTAVPNTPEPEVVQLRSIETVGDEKRVTVGNVAGDYVLVCNEAANEKQKHPIPSCISPRPQANYLLFRSNTKWVTKGATNARVTIDLAFMQDFTVSYNDSENIGLLPTRDRNANEPFGVYWLLSWTAKTSR